MSLDRNDEQGRDGSPELAGHHDDAEGAAALVDWKPARDGDGGIRECACLAHAKEEADCEQRIETCDQSCERSEDRPPEHDAREHAASANAIAQRAAWNLKDGVGKDEDSGDPAPGIGPEAERLLHARAGDRDADAVEVGDDQQQAQHAKNTIANLHARHAPFLSGFALLYQPIVPGAPLNGPLTCEVIQPP